MRRVIDASVAVKWFCPEPMAESADRILAFGFELLAPDFLIIECANVLWKKWRKGEFDLKDADAAIGYLSSGPVTLTRTTELIPQSLVLARELSHSVYDCLYLALAQEVSGIMITADTRFVKRAHENGYGSVVQSVASLN